MEKYGLFILLLASFLIALWMVDKRQNILKVANMKIVSSAFQNNSIIPGKYTCDGENISPPLFFMDIPQNAKSLVLIVDDPDAPMRTFVHWILFNINPSEREIEENSAPRSSSQGLTSAGQPGYVGACPPSGAHRYFFKLYALDMTLDLQKADKQIIEEKMQGHTIAKAELIGIYTRK